MRSTRVGVQAQAALVPSGFLSNVTTLVQCWKKGHQGWQIMIFKSKQNSWVKEMLLLLKKSPHAPPSQAIKGFIELCYARWCYLARLMDKGDPGVPPPSCREPNRHNSIAEVWQWSPMPPACLIPLCRELSFSQDRFINSFQVLLTESCCSVHVPAAWDCPFMLHQNHSPLHIILSSKTPKPVRDMHQTASNSKTKKADISQVGGSHLLPCLSPCPDIVSPAIRPHT